MGSCEIVNQKNITLYRDDWNLISHNPVVKATDISFSIENKKLILVDNAIFM